MLRLFEASSIVSMQHGTEATSEVPTALSSDSVGPLLLCRTERMIVKIPSIPKQAQQQHLRYQQRPPCQTQSTVALQGKKSDCQNCVNTETGTRKQHLRYQQHPLCASRFTAGLQSKKILIGNKMGCTCSQR